MYPQNVQCSNQPIVFLDMEISEFPNSIPMSQWTSIASARANPVRDHADDALIEKLKLLQLENETHPLDTFEDQGKFAEEAFWRQ
jgi:hypothetical protein